MFYYLDGIVAELLPYLAVIDCNGVGYACKTTNNTLSRLKKGQKGRVYTYLNVGEGIFDLYGFATQNELNSFKMLLGVSGVGPKAALAILSVGTPETLAMAKSLLILQAVLGILKADSMGLVVGIFRAGGDTMFACLLDTGTVWLVGVPLGFLAVFLGAPLWGVTLCVYCDDIAKVAVGFVHLFRENWVKNVTAQIQEG